MADFIPIGSRWGNFASHLGTGLGNSAAAGLDLLTQHKLNQIGDQYALANQQKLWEQQQKQFSGQRDSISQLFQSGGIEPETSDILAQVLQTNPKAFTQMLQMLGQGAAPQEGAATTAAQSLAPSQAIPGMPQQQQAPQVTPQWRPPMALPNQAQQAAPQMRPQMAPQQAQPQKLNFAQQIARGIQARGATGTAGKPATIAQEKFNETLKSQYEKLRDVADTSDRMLTTLKDPKMEYGFIANAKSMVAPNWLEAPTENYDTDAAHLVNLKAEDLKGAPSRFRVGLIVKEKPGVQHSPTANRSILNRYRKEALARMEEMRRSYPELFGQEGNSEASMGEEPKKKVGNEPEQFAPEGEQPEGWGSKIARTALAPLKLLGVPAALGERSQESINELPEGQERTLEQGRKDVLHGLAGVHDYVAKKLGVDPQAKGLVEKTLNDVVATAPIAVAIASTGGAALPLVFAKDAVMSAAGNIADEFGLGTPARVLSALAGGKLFDKVAAKAGVATAAKTLNSLADTTKKEMYNTVKTEGEAFTIPSTQYDKKLSSIIDKSADDWRFVNDASARTSLQQVIQKIESNRTGTLSGSELVKRSQELNSVINRSKQPVKDYLIETKKLVQETAEELAKKNGDKGMKWFNTWKGADKIHIAQNIGKNLAEGIEENAEAAGKVVTSPILGRTIDMLIGYPIHLVGKPIELAFKAGGQGIAKGKQVWEFSKDPITQKLLNQAAYEFANRNTKAALTTLARVNNHARAYSE